MTTDGFHIKQSELPDSKQYPTQTFVISYQLQNQKDGQYLNWAKKKKIS